ncbi:hypothetical protein AMECASPLE_030776 [Ameca splendens]|uniref:Uncharacterized protein n=1 Tax=Ameca splendens TaxID=208324 RepID=A0ABV0ZEU8_9TELE
MGQTQTVPMSRNQTNTPHNSHCNNSPGRDTNLLSSSVTAQLIQMPYYTSKKRTQPPCSNPSVAPSTKPMSSICKCVVALHAPTPASVLLEWILLDNSHKAAVLPVAGVPFPSTLLSFTQISVNMLGYRIL